MGGIPWPKTGATHYHAQLGLPDKGRAIKGLVVCNSWDLEPYDLLNGLALGCYQPSPEVLIVSTKWKRKIILKLTLPKMRCNGLFESASRIRLSKEYIVRVLNSRSKIKQKYYRGRLLICFINNSIIYNYIIMSQNLKENVILKKKLL